MCVYKCYDCDLFITLQTIPYRSINDNTNLLIQELRANATNFSKLTPVLQSDSEVRATSLEVYLSMPNQESGTSPLQLFFLQY